MRIIFHGDYSQPTQEIDIKFETDTNVSTLKDALSEILKTFKIENDKEFYCLMRIKEMKFITEKDLKQIYSTTINNNNDILIQLIDVRIFATECINNLKDCYKTALFEKNQEKDVQIMHKKLNYQG